MNKTCSFILGTLVSLAGLVGLSGAALAFPDRAVTLVVPYAAGGPTDVAARIAAEEMSKTLGEAVVVENRPGAGTMVGAEHVARSTPDGHTLLVTAATTFSTNPHMFADIRYGIDDFAPVSMMARVPFAFVVTNAFPAQTMEEFIDYARANPGEVDLGTLGAGTVPHIIGGMLEDQLGIELSPIPYGGAAPILTDVLAGNLDSYIASVADAGPNHSAGQYRALALLTANRVDQLPGIPTMVELGYADMVADSWFAAFAPAGTPDEIVAALNEAMVAAVESEAFTTRMIALGNIPESSSAEELRSFVVDENQRWGAMIEQLGLQPN